MTNKVQIANRALTRIAKDRINSFTENSPEAILVNELYDSVRREVLDEGPWSFATKRVELAKLTTTPAWGFTAEFELPSDFIQMIEIPEEEGDIDYQVEGFKLLANINSLKIKYTADITNEAIWSPKFIKCVYLKLALEMTTAFRRNETLAKRLAIEYGIALSEGLARDAQQSSKEVLRSGDLIDDRRGN